MKKVNEVNLKIIRHIASTNEPVTGSDLYKVIRKPDGGVYSVSTLERRMRESQAEGYLNSYRIKNKSSGSHNGFYATEKGKNL